MGYVGTYDRTIFYNPSNKYCIISVKTSDQSVQHYGTYEEVHLS